MALSNEVRRLNAKWETGNAWPQFLEWIEIKRIRGWHEQRVEFRFPMVAVVGENGSGKSTLLQAAACVYQSSDQHGVTKFPSEFFPETAWDTLQDVRIGYGYKEGDHHDSASIRKPTTRWLGQPDRRRRNVEYIDLSRLQPVATRVGYARIAKNRHTEASAVNFTDRQLARLSQIMGSPYDSAKMAKCNLDQTREIPVLARQNQPYSGFHQGSGETTIAELLQSRVPNYGLILIDEIESSLHPRAQRRLVRDLAQLARETECQIVFSTHSPYVLEELPLQARIYILDVGGRKEIVYGVSPQFAMTKMDDENYPECELYVEDVRAQVWLREILSRHAPDLLMRSAITPYGAANLGVALGEMAAHNRFRQPTCVFLDGDKDDAVGCVVLPGGDAPERVVCDRLRRQNWGNLFARIGRDSARISDAFGRAMTIGDHKEWLRVAANDLQCGGDVLWQAMSAEWADNTPIDEVRYLLDRIQDAFA